MRSSYEPGTFSWVDLSTSDADGAKSFYGGLFGWEFVDGEIPGGGIYTTCHIRGGTVAAISQQDEHPGHWNNYVTVESADETTAKAKELGATVIEEPFDVMDAGRMAVFADPSGAMLCVWEARENIGADLVNDVGCLTINQLNTREPERAADFYRNLFGWEITQVSDDPPFWGITNKGWLNGGMMGMPDGAGAAPPHWLAYFVSENLEEDADKIGDLGGKIIAPPMSVPPDGRILVAQDPQGATFALFEGRTDD